MFMPMIIGEIRRYLRDNNAVRVSRSVRDLAYRALSAKEEIERETASEPTTKQIADRLGEEEAKVCMALEAIAEPLSLFDPVCCENGDSLCLMDQISDGGTSEDDWLESLALTDALKTLGERERSVIDLRFHRGKTQMEIAAQIGISQAQVSRIEKSALDKIKRKIQ